MDLRGRKRLGHILRVRHQQMNDAIATLDLPAHTHHHRPPDLRAQTLIDLWTEDEIGDRALVLDGHENDALRR